ncbi:MAG TPA: hypothetical protein VFJ58_24395, partial [Armatimonadota bacterium]|nr:hypothetical protein [Armatimonadota bacterium]
HTPQRPPRSPTTHQQTAAPTNPKGHRAQAIVVQLQSSTGSPATDAFQMSFSGDRLVPYVDYLRGGLQLPIFRIIIGPGWQLATLNSLDAARNHVVQGIARLLMARGLHQVAIDRSRIPYDPK